MRGKVIFVGAGAGSADLLTLRAVRSLERADVVLHDDLVAREVLEFASPAAVVRSVGKRCGQAGVSQEELNRIMVEYAERGNMVVRLKSGDPGIFGRLGEEIDALQEAGIEFEIVPGVTAALASAAAARITLTDRRSASSVVLAAGSLAGGKRQDWSKILAHDSTLVIYMPGRDFAALGAELRGSGAPADTPCAVVWHAGARDETVEITSVAELGKIARREGPALVIVGQVVAQAKAPVQVDTETVLV